MKSDEKRPEIVMNKVKFMKKCKIILLMVVQMQKMSQKEKNDKNRSAIDEEGPTHYKLNIFLMGFQKHMGKCRPR